MSNLSRRNIIAGLATIFTAQASLTAFLFYRQGSQQITFPKPPQNVLAFDEFIRQSTDLLRQSPFGQRLLEDFEKRKKIIRPYKMEEDIAHFDSAAMIYRTDKQEIVVSTEESDRDSTYLFCKKMEDQYNRSSSDTQNCVNDILASRYVALTYPKPASLAHELMHFRQDVMGLEDINDKILVNTKGENAEKLLYFSEFASDLASIRVSYELFALVPESRNNLAKALDMTFGTLDPFKTYFNIMLSRDIPQSIKPGAAVEAVLAEIIKTNRYAGLYGERANAYNEFAPKDAGNDIDPVLLGQYCKMYNQSLQHGEFLTPDRFLEIKFQPSARAGRVQNNSNSIVDPAMK